MYHLNLKRAREEFLRWYVLNLLIRHQGDVEAAAIDAGYERSAFSRLLKRIGLAGMQRRLRAGLRVNVEEYDVELFPAATAFEHISSYTRQNPKMTSAYLSQKAEE